MKKLIEMIKELKKNTKSKALLFFGFYFVFFIIVIMLIRLGPKSGLKNYEKNNNPNYFSFGVLNSRNYHFNYNVNLDGNKYIYVGDKYSYSELFEYNDKKYYRENDVYYVLDNTWNKCDMPYINDLLVNSDNLIELIRSSYYESSTTFNSGESVYNFLLSSNSINKILYNKDTDIDEVPNKIIVTLDLNKNIKKIELNLDNYCVNSDLCDNNFKLELEYSEYGEIGEIKSPVNN